MSMTRLQKQTVIAVACGYKFAHISSDKDKRPVYYAPGSLALTSELPDYPGDLNAMREARKVLTPAQIKEYVGWLDVVCGGELELSSMVSGDELVYGLVDATAEQHADAFIATLGLAAQPVSPAEDGMDVHQVTAGKIMKPLNSLRVARVMEYNPDAYLDYCEENNNTPTQEGFLEFIQDWIDEDFRNDNGTEDIQEFTET